MPRSGSRRCAAWAAAALVVVLPLTLVGLPGAAQATATTGTTVTRVAGNGNSGTITAGPGLSSELDLPWRLAVDPDGDVFVAFNGGSTVENSIAKYSAADGEVHYFANDDQDVATPVAGPALSSPFEAVEGIAADSAGNVYASDFNSYDIVKITPTGTLSIFAGSSTNGAPVAGVAATAATITPKSLAVGPDDTVYFLDEDTYSVWRVDPNGLLAHVAGNGSNGVPVTGAGQPATSSPLVEVVALAVDSAGNVFIADQGMDCVVMVEASTGDLLPVVGTCNSSGAAVQGPASASGLSTLGQIAIDRNDDLYLVDQSNGYIEKVTDPASGSGELSFIAGDGSSSGDVVDGPALSSPVDQVTGIAVDADLNVYLGEGDGHFLSMIPATPSVPDAPTGLAGTAGDRRVTLTFTPAVDDGGSAVLRYQYSLDGGATWRPVTGTWPTTTSAGQVSGSAGGLTAGQTYAIKVRAVNAVGNGPASGAVSATVPDSDDWFHDSISRTQRSREIAVPSNPKRYRGAQRFTRARNRAHGGQLAMPIPAIQRRELDAQQAAVLADDGLFEFNSGRLTTSGRRQVRALVASLDSAQAISCEGYADYAGAPWWEYQLSKARAKAVCAALRNGGVTARSRSVGYGPERPVIVGGRASHREENRRVVVLVTR